MTMMSDLGSNRRLRKRQSIPERISPSGSTAHARSLQRRSTIIGGNNSSFMDSFRAVLEDFDEHDKETEEQSDQLGSEITRILNRNPIFRAPLHLGIDGLDEEEEDSFTFRPLFSSKNWKWTQRRWHDLIEMNASDGRLWKSLFQNSKPFSSGISAFFGFVFFTLCCVSTVTTVASIWASRFIWLISMTSLTVLVDLQEISMFLPEQVRLSVGRLIPSIVWVDDVMLWGGRYRGREWSKWNFEGGDSKGAPSFARYLRDLPPPSVLEVKRGLTLEGKSVREQRSNDTAKHVASIGFCHAMLQEAFVRNQFSKLRKAVQKKKGSKTKTNALVRSDSPKALVQAYDFTRSSSAPTKNDMEQQPAETIDALLESDGLEPSSSVGRSSHRRKSVVFDKSITLEDLEAKTFDDDVDFSALDGILEDDDSCSGDSIARESDTSNTNSESTTDLNWMDVGAEIGMKILGSAVVQKAMTSHDTAERIVTISEKVGNKLGASNVRAIAVMDEESEDKALVAKQKAALSKLAPVHSMWTSASAAATTVAISPVNTIETSSSEDSLSKILILDETTPATEPSRGSFALNRFSSPRHATSTPWETYDASKVQTQNSTLKVEKLKTDPPVTSVKCQVFEDIPANNESIELVREKKRAPKTPSGHDTTIKRRPLMLPDIKIAVPIFPFQPGSKYSKSFHPSHFQMATVVTSKRLSVFQKNKLPLQGRRGTNCLAVTVHLDKSFLRDGKFARMTFRVMDEWNDRYMPRHSKLPLGSCVSTTFGLGVLVGWRVEDDCHVVRSLWQRRGAGSACAYLQRNAIYSTVQAAIGFEVETPLGNGEVVGYIDGGREFNSGKYIVKIKDRGKREGQSLVLGKRDVLSCKSARFIPVVEHIKEAVQYQLQVDSYNAALQEDAEGDTLKDLNGKTWRKFSKYSDLLWKSFLRATEEDDDFDEGMNAFITSVVSFFDRLDAPSGAIDSMGNDLPNILITATDSTHSSKQSKGSESNFWFMNDVFGIFGGKEKENGQDNMESIEVEQASDEHLSKKSFQRTYDRAFAVIRTLMRTVSITRAGCMDEPEFKLALSLCYEFLIFVKTVIKVQQKNVSPQSLTVWCRAWEEIVSTFGPLKERLQKIGQGIADRMEKHGRRAKVRLLRFVDTVVQDEILLVAIEQGNWRRCGEQIESAIVKARIIDEESREHYQKTAQFMYNNFAAIAAKNGDAAARNNEKLANLAIAIQYIAAPRRSILRLLVEDKVLDALERVLVRVFDNEQIASQMLSIHASNFHTLRQFRMLKDFTIAGKFWMPLLDAADAEFSFMVSRMPQNAKDFMYPISSLFSLCVVQFHKISEGDLTKDWLDFLVEDDAISIVHDIDMKLILALESFSRDIKEMMVVLPYYPSIEDDILNLVDEMDIDEFLKEASDAVDDPEKLSEFIREKATVAIERFLDYLPKMSIPVEKRDLADGWVLTCRGADGGDLTLTDLSIKRENLTCQVMGGDTLFFPMLGTDEKDCKSEISAPASSSTTRSTRPPPNDTSVLHLIRDMLINAQQDGCWEEGIGGGCQLPSDRYVASVLHGIPVSSVLNCGIELWRSLEIDDDELLEIAIRDVSYQIQLQQDYEERGEVKECKDEHTPTAPRQPLLARYPEVSEPYIHRFNPRVDPSVLYLEMQKLTFHLDKFLFRIEKHESRRTVFDPVFEGSGSLLVRNVSIKLRVECVKDYVEQMGRRRAVPLLQIRELEVQLEKVKLKVKDTGADWLLNKVVKSFEGNITHILATNLNEQVRAQMELALTNLNGYFAVNPEIVLGLLDISMDDLEEKVVWV